MSMFSSYVQVELVKTLGSLPEIEIMHVCYQIDDTIFKTLTISEFIVITKIVEVHVTASRQNNKQ